MPALAMLLDSLLEGLVTLDKNLDVSPIRVQITRILSSKASIDPGNSYQNYHTAFKALQDESGHLSEVKRHVTVILAVLEHSGFQNNSDNVQLKSLLSPLGRVDYELISLP